MMNRSGKVALVSGAHRGIGWAIVQAVRAAGARVHAGMRVPDGSPEALAPDVTDDDARVPGPKLAPSDVAEAIVTTLRDGAEEVYRGPAADIAARLAADPHVVVRQFAGLFGITR